MATPGQVLLAKASVLSDRNTCSSVEKLPGQRAGAAGEGEGERGVPSSPDGPLVPARQMAEPEEVRSFVLETSRSHPGCLRST